MLKTMAENQGYVVCVRNEGFGSSLEVRKIYGVVADDSASANHLLRIVDESGEDYLYPEDYFVTIELPDAVRQALRKAG